MHSERRSLLGEPPTLAEGEVNLEERAYVLKPEAGTTFLHFPPLREHGCLQPWQRIHD